MILCRAEYPVGQIHTNMRNHQLNFCETKIKAIMITSQSIKHNDCFSGNFFAEISGFGGF